MPETRKEHRVFIVHDEFVVASSLAAILRRKGFDARSFTDPLRALSAAVSEAPELLISDFLTPRLSGGELASQVRLHNPNCEVIFFSRQALTGPRIERERSDQRYLHSISTPAPSPENLKAISVECEFAS